MILYGDTEDDLTARNAFRAMEVGYAVIDAAEQDPAVWEWLEALLHRIVTNPGDRELLQLSPLEPPAPHLPFKLVK